MRSIHAVVACLLMGACSPTRPPPESDGAAPGAADAGAERAPITNPALRDELLSMMAKDQRAREAFIEQRKAGDRPPTTDSMAVVLNVKQVDASNMVRMKEIIGDHGWPTISMVGEDGAHAAWILVQHADTDPDFQAEVLVMLEAAVAEGEAAKADYALLVDRVRLARGEAQVYATQFEQNEAGEWVPRPTEDLEHVDERRAAMGLEPMEAYRRRIVEMYGPSED